MEQILPALGIIALLAVLGSIVGSLRVSRAKAILNHWAKTNGYDIVSKELRLLRRGPFWWKTKQQEIYYVTVRTPEGQTRRGWVRCGGPLFGNGAVVRWDE